MKRLILLASALLITQSGLAQTGLISGRVIGPENEPVTDAPVNSGGDEITSTDDDGHFEVDDDLYGDGTSITVRYVWGDEPEIYFDPEGENSCEEDQENEEDCEEAGAFLWGSGDYVFVLGDDPYVGPDDGRGMDDMTDMYDDGMNGDGDGMYGGEIAIGYSLEFENIKIMVRGHADLPIEAPVSICVGLDYIPIGDGVSIIAPMVDVAYTHDINETTSVYGGGGLRMYRQRFSFQGFSSTSTETGFGLRGGGLHDVGPVDAFAELDLGFAYSTTIPSFRVGARMMF